MKYPMKLLSTAITLGCLLAVTANADLVLRQSTASQAVMVGPFVDSTDGNTAETGLTVDAADVRLSKNGANIVGKNSGGCTHDELGYYTCTFDATDSDTVGRLQVMVHESGALPVYHEFQVAEEAVFDACCASGAAPLTAAAIAQLDVSDNDDTADSWGERISRVPNAVAGAAGGIFIAGTNAATTVTTAFTTTFTGNLTGNVNGTVNGLTATAQGNVRTALGMASANLDTQLSGLDGKIDTIDSIVDTIVAKTNQLTFGVANQVNANTESMNANALCGTGDSGTPWTGCP